MKTLTPIFASAVLLALSAASPSLAQMKGGERLNSFHGPTPAPFSPAVQTMNCRTETRTVVDRTGRGGIRTTVYTVYNCPSCRTREVVKGVGKLASRKLEHSCDNASACCGTKS